MQAGDAPGFISTSRASMGASSTSATSRANGWTDSPWYERDQSVGVPSDAGAGSNGSGGGTSDGAGADADAGADEVEVEGAAKPSGRSSAGGAARAARVEEM
jgi:hypothetical protein